MRQTWRLTVTRPFRFILGGVLLIVALSLVAIPFTGLLISKWSQFDVQSRSRLVLRAIEGPVDRALTSGDEAELAALLEAVARDERILGVGLCDESQRLRGATRLMPPSFSCDQIDLPGVESFSRITSEGLPVFAASFPVGPPEAPAHLIVLHDLSYIGARLAQARTLIGVALVGVALVTAAIAGLLLLLVMRGWMTSLRQAVEDLRAGKPQSGERPALSNPIQTLLKSLDAGRAPTDSPDVEWTPQTLHNLLLDALPDAEVIVVSNREPYIHNNTDEGVVLQTPASGLVSALEPVMRACGGTWIAHGSGTADQETVDAGDTVAVPPDDPAYRLRRIWLTEEEQDGYYYGFANEGLWPLCHIAFVRPTFRESDWHYYTQVNERFAEAVAREARTEDPIVLVQDYHFALAPKMIRERLPKATIITFWHIPWPNAETFGICPWKEQILEGLLGSSILGFHTHYHCNNFFETVDRFIESRIDREYRTVTLGGDETAVRPYPISIAWPPKALAAQPPVEVCRAQVRAQHGLDPDHKVAVGIERFDYTKGILDRMRSIDLLLEQKPEWKGRFTFLQVAAPTRSKLASYSRLQEEAVELADEINARHGDGDYRPIRLLIRHHEPWEVFRIFRAADLCIVSSLHDGMNLVAKEFVAARDDDAGVLILSTFTGAARELSEALIVNPYDGGEMAAALHTALNMPPEEQRERMRQMRQQVREQNVYRWAGRMLIDAGRIRRRQRILDLAREQ
ncbi:trehalose-6-phosphate synthase [Paracoccus sp. Z118]|uniref:alpha,alpha-trehalose-phosphate synthase (UDP-forming) n=1 Tax=Paracoccus sp. Z118 TaxID=2851017 RepID=UPI001C2BE3E8|nr:trehalose-6-phosphate synthase [Paracoccus sp. Z118]MBV0892599.1 trehalose-6-phosphate synthase [Paracoccus sp. Z118]